MCMAHSPKKRGLCFSGNWELFIPFGFFHGSWRVVSTLNEILSFEERSTVDLIQKPQENLSTFVTIVLGKMGFVERWS